jgi:hypothetical protein
MVGAVINWLWAGLAPFVVGALIFMIKTNPNQAEANLHGWGHLIGRGREWLRAQWWTAPLAILLIALGGIVTGIRIEPYLEAFQVDQKFAQARQINPGLGVPLGPSRSSIIYLESHDHALVLWSATLGIHFALWPNSMVSQQPDTDWEIGAWNNDKITQERLGLSASCLPPRGGVARDWNNDPKNWSKMGCRKWYCTTAALVQEFKNGYLIGPIGHRASNADLPLIDSRIIAISGRKWSSAPSAFKASKCPPDS